MFQGSFAITNESCHLVFPSDPLHVYYVLSPTTSHNVKPFCVSAPTPYGGGLWRA